MSLDQKKLTREEIEKLSQDAWLNIDVNEQTLCDLFSNVPQELEDKPYLWYTYLLTKPEYFHTLCKNILNVDLMPYQVVTLMQMWKHKFPMLIASRGFSKSYLLAVYSILRCLLMPGRKVIVCGSAFRQSKIIFEYIVNIWNNAPILRDIMGSQSGPRYGTDRWLFRLRDSTITALPIGNGDTIRGMRANDIITDEFSCLASGTLVQTDIGLVKIENYMKTNAMSLLNIDKNLELPSYPIKTPLTDVYKITTVGGYSFKCSSIHKVYTTKGWKLAKDLVTKTDILPLDQNKYFPQRYIVEKGFVLDQRTGYLLGFLLAEGSNTNRNVVTCSNNNKAILDRIVSFFPEYDWTIDYKEPYKDGRGWDCQGNYILRTSNTEFRTTLRKLGLDYVTSQDKEIPEKILQSPQSVIIEFLKGLFEGDGSCFQYKHLGKKRIGITYYSVSEELINQLQVLLLKFGIIGYKTKRSSKISKKQNYMLAMRGYNAKKIYDLLKVEKWSSLVDGADFLERKPYIRQNGQRYTVSTYRNNKSIHIGTYDSEEECVKAFEDFWDCEPEAMKVKSVELLPEKEHLYDFYMPETHSFRAGGFIQHNSGNLEVFETVIAGFAAVRSNPVDSVKHAAASKFKRMMGIIEEGPDETGANDNQIIISGTAYYSFNHFYDYWQRWKKIILSRGNKAKLMEILNDSSIPKGFNWKDYAIIRIPYDLLPDGYVDEAQISRTKATSDPSRMNNEYYAVFSKDSNGFFRRAMIEACVTNKPIITVGGHEILPFNASLYGNLQKRYVFGIDPASENDNLAITILELNGEYRKIVYAWTTNRKIHTKLVQEKLVRETDYFGYCARKIRTLMSRFPTEHIGLDTQGGGYALMEALHDVDKLKEGEIPIYPIIDPNKKRDTDNFVGLHIIYPIQFASADWTANANYNLRKDLGEKNLLFPAFDPALLASVTIENDENKIQFDTLEECMLDIEELKDELASIVMTATPSGRERWDTPDKLVDGKKGTMRKDRYSAILIANAIGREIYRNPTVDFPDSTQGGFAGYRSQKDLNPRELFHGQPWLNNLYEGLYD